MPLNSWGDSSRRQTQKSPFQQFNFHEFTPKSPAEFPIILAVPTYKGPTPMNRFPSYSDRPLPPVSLSTKSHPPSDFAVLYYTYLTPTDLYALPFYLTLFMTYTMGHLYLSHASYLPRYFPEIQREQVVGDAPLPVSIL